MPGPHGRKVRTVMSDLHAKLTAKRNRQVSDDEADAIIEMAEESTDVLIDVAKANSTRDTKDIIQASSIYLEHVVAGLTGDKAREFLAKYNAGERIVLDATYAQVLDEKATLEEQVKDLQNTASGNRPRLQLGGGSDPVEQAKAQLDAHPEFAEHVGNILAVFVDAVNNGATEDDLKVRADLAGKIMLGEDPDYKIGQGTAGTAPTIQMVVDARNKAAQAEAAKQAAENELTREKTPSIPNTLAWQLEQARNSTQPTPAADQVAKATLKSDVDTLVTAINGARGLGNDKKVAVSTIRTAVTNLATQAGTTTPA